MSRSKEKETAIKLRKKGYSYSEILKKVPVAKSTLSLWLRSVGLAKKQKQRLTDKKKAAQQKGAEARRRQRIEITKEIKDKSRKEIEKISNKELWLIGIALYWAEGEKEKMCRSGTSTSFANSDPKMVRVYLKWLKECCGIAKNDIKFRIYLHETAAEKIEKVQKHWAKTTNSQLDKLEKISWKKNKIKTNRVNIEENYNGLLQIRVKRSVNLNRKISGWIEGIYKQCGIV